MTKKIIVALAAFAGLAAFGCSPQQASGTSSAPRATPK